MTMKNSGTYVRSQVGELPCDKSGTQVFPLPPRAGENARRSEPDPIEVSLLTTVGVGTAEPPKRANGSASMESAHVTEPKPSGEHQQVARTPAVPPPRRVRATPIINVNEPTRIFVISPPPLAEKNSDGVERGSPKPNSDASGRTETFGTPSFSPVPSVSFSRPPQPAGVLAARPPQPAGVLAARAPQPAGVLASRASQAANWKGPERSAAKPSGEASQLTQTLAEPLLRAFDDGRARQATWSTAKTITALVLPVATEDEGAKAEDDRVDGDEAKSSRLGVPRRLLENLRQSSATTRISALVMVVVVVIGLGALVAGRIADGVVPDRGSSVVAQPMRAAPVEPRAAMAVPAVPPNSALIPSSPSLVEAAAAEPSTARSPASKVDPAPASRDKPVTAPDVGAPSEVTLARQAVDALLAGDRPKALLQYKELARKAPDRKVYREAIRLLAPTATDTPQ